MRPRLHSFLAFLLLVSLSMAGCAISNPGGQPLPSMTFDHVIPLRVDVGAVQIEQPPEHFDRVPENGRIEPFIVPPDEAVHQYLLSRFVPGGTKDTLKISIERADAVLREKPSSNKLGRMVGIAGVDEYELTIKLNVMVLEDDGFERLSKMIKGTRLIRVSEHASLAAREGAQYEGLEGLLADLDQAVTRTIVQEFGL